MTGHYWLHAGVIVVPIQVRGDRKPCLSAGGADKPEDLLVAVERLAGPVLRDLGEETMLDGIPLERARGVVRHGDGEAEEIDKLGLEFGLPGAPPIPIAAARIAEKEQGACPTIPHAAIVLPPARNRAGRKGRGIVGDTDGHAPAIGEQIVHAVRNGHADRLRAKVVIVDHAGLPTPPGAWVLEGADQFALFGIHADDGQASTLEAMAQVTDIEKLLVSIWTRVGGQLFVVDAERIAHLVEQSGDRVGADGDPEVPER